MKTLSLALKTITVGLTLVSSVSFAAEASPAEKFVDKAELMQILREGGLPEGVQTGKSTDNNDCELTIDYKAGEEKFEMKSSTDEYAQRLILTKDDYQDIDSVPFIIRETKNGISIKLDFKDNTYQDVKIEKSSKTQVNLTFIETIDYDVRTLTCTFSK